MHRQFVLLKQERYNQPIDHGLFHEGRMSDALTHGAESGCEAKGRAGADLLI